MTTTQPPDAGTDVDVTVSTADASTTPVTHAEQGRELKPLLASWLKDRGEFTEKVTDVSRRTGHDVAWHTLHSPLHVLRILRYAPRGLWRVIKLIWRWVMDAEGKPLRQEAVNANQASDYLKLVKERRERIHRRWIGLVAMTVVTLLLLMLAWMLLPSWQVTSWFTLTSGWVFALLSAGVVAGLGYVGRPINKPLIQHATAVNGETKLSGDIVLRALCSIGIQKMTKPEEIELLYGVKPTRAGYHIDLTLPFGVTATAVMAKREELSSGLQRGIGTVWPAVGPRHAGHLQLFISHEDMSAAKQKPWPLLKGGTVNLFQPVPMFTDQQGDWVDMPPLATTCGLIGAVPRMGKTYFQRELSLVCSLDVRCEQYIFELKGTGDLSCAKLYAHYYSDSDEEDDIAEHLEVMRGLAAERRRRSKVIRDLPNDQCPRSEVTDELASRPELGLHPILIEVDECQVWFTHMDKRVKDEFERLADDLVRKGPAVGIMAYFSTQELGKDSIPPSVRRNASIRVCFKVNDPDANNKVLGPGSYANGYQATMFDFYKDKGIAYLRAEGPPRIVRTVASMDKVEADKVALRARALRQQADRLSGYALGEGMEREVEEVILLDDVRQAMGTAQAMHLCDLAPALAELRPGAWGALDADSLGSQLRTAGVRVANVHVTGKPRYKASNKGVKREWLEVSTTEQVGNTDPEEGNVRQLRPTP